MNIIPAIDLMNGQCVRLSEGDFSTRKVYYKDPLEAAKAFEAAGLTHLHIVDLDGARSGEVQHWTVLETIAANTSLTIDFSGGIKTEAAAAQAFQLGAQKITVGSLAVKEPQTVGRWLQRFGAEKIIIGADVKDGSIAIHGWQEASGLSVMDYIHSYLEKGAVEFLCTDVSKDGLLQGPSLILYRDILERFPQARLIASGGVASIEDLKLLRKTGCSSAIVGKAIYEKRVTLEALMQFEHEAKGGQDVD